MSHDIKHNIKQQSTWKRGLYMLLFSVFYQLAIAILLVIIVFQFVLKLLTGDTNQQLRDLSLSISEYIYQVLSFLSFNSEDHPYPFSDWPQQLSETRTRSKTSETDMDEVLKKIDQDSDVDGD